MRKSDLTYPQKRVWYMEKIEPNTPVNNLGGFVEFKGEFDSKILKRAIEQLINNCNTFKMRIFEEEGLPYCYDGEDLFRVGTLKFNSRSESIDWMKMDFKKPFNIEEGFLFNFKVVKINESLGGYYIKLHHLIADGWSFQVITDTIALLYKKLVKGEKVSKQYLNSLSYDYKQRELSYFSSHRFKKDEQYWCNTLKGSRCLDRNNNFLSYSINKGNRLTFKVQNDRSRKIDDFISSLGISGNSFFVGLINIYLYKLKNLNDITIGNPILNRIGKKEKNSIGMYTSTMPFRYIVDGNLHFESFIKDVNKSFLSSIKHQQYPYQLLKNKHETSKELFDIAVNFYNTSLTNELGGLKIINHEFYNGVQWLPLEIIIKNWSSESYELLFDYDTAIYTENQITSMYTQITNMIDQIIAAPNKRIKEIILPQLPVEECNCWKDNIPYRSIINMFEEQVFLKPSNIALKDGRTCLTYFDLFEKVEIFSSYLKYLGVREGEKVAIKVNNSIETIVGILAVLKIGAVFIPIGNNIPISRLKFIIQESDCGYLIVKDSHRLYHEFKNMAALIDMNQVDFESKVETNNEIHLSNHAPDTLAYIIYTSGSTGKPKGVMINHKSISNYVQWASLYYLNQSGVETFAFYSNIAFDLTLTSILVPLVTGNRITIYNSKSAVESLKKVFTDDSTTIVKLTPTHLRYIDEKSLINCKVKLLIVGGENLYTSLARKISEISKGEIKIVNEYGPTEATIGCIAHTYDFSLDIDITVPIGRPIPNTKAYLLDEELCEVSKGDVGNLFIGGEALSGGYINNMAQNKEKFIENPFSENEILYKTDDLCRLDSNNNFVYIGRNDKQIKIQGNRVELNEIEISISKYIGNKEVSVQVLEEDGTKFLLAFIETDSLIDRNSIIRNLKSKLPNYMIPSDIILVNEFPVTVNGKIDNKKLIENYQKSSSIPEEKTEMHDKDIIDVFKSVLKEDDISLNDNFFHLGGDSIKAIQISSKLKNFGVNLKVKDILNNSVIKNTLQNATYVGNFSNDGNKIESGEIPLTPIANWFLNNNFNNIHYWNQSISVKFNKNISVDKLIQAVQKIYEYHDGLRINYNITRNNLFYNNKTVNEIISIYYDFTNRPFYLSKDIIKAETEDQKRNFNIYTNRLFKVLIFEFSDSIFMVMVGHHLVVDIVSWKVILEDLYELVENQNSLPPKSVSIKDWSKLVAAGKKGNDLKDNLTSYYHPLKVDFNKGQDILATSELIYSSLGKSETQLILKEANKSYNTNAYHLLLSALFLAVFKNGLGNDITILVEDHGRTLVTDVDISRTVGWFTSIYPVTYQLDNRKSKGTLIKEVKEIVGNSKNNFYIPDSMNNQDGISFILFNYLGVIDDNEMNSLFEIVDMDTGEDISIENQMISPLEINVFIIKNELKFNIRYSRNKFKSETILNLSYSLKTFLLEIANHCISKTSVNYTPSDFETINISQEELDSIFE